MIVTNEGSIFAAAAATVPSSVGLLAAGTVVTLIGDVVPPSTRYAYEPTPAPAPITAASDAAAKIAPSRRGGFVAVRPWYGASDWCGASGSAAYGAWLTCGTPAGAGKSDPE